jgi:hypothetical protein
VASPTLGRNSVDVECYNHAERDAPDEATAPPAISRLGLKIKAALLFTTNSFAMNLGTDTPRDPAFPTMAHNAVAPVVDAANLQTSLDASNHLTQIQPEHPAPAVALVGQAHDTTHAAAYG